MQPTITKFYDQVPLLLQNILISSYGLGLYFQRYGKIQRNHLDYLRMTQWYSKERMEDLQFQQLSRLLDYAYTNVPFYQQAFETVGLKPTHIKCAKDLSKLPIITKKDIRENPRLFVSHAVKRKRFIPIHTSGTTGSPLTLYFQKKAIQKNYAFFARFLEWAGVKTKDRSATFAGRLFIPPHQRKPPFWRKNWIMNDTLFSSYHISDENAFEYIQKLEDLDPVFIDSYPSALYVISRYILSNGLEPAWNLKAIVTSSETLLEHQREAIEKAFRCKVYDQYGSAEMVAFISQCEKGKYHVNSDYGIVECVRDGVVVSLEEPGDLVCTGFLNYAMPLIRYKIGDSAVISKESCACGRSFPVVESIAGRVDDLITTKDGRYVGRLDPVFKNLATNINEAQIIQEDYDNITVKIVRAEGYSVKEEKAIVAELKARVGVHFKITVDYVDEIPRTSNGKFRSVISRVQKK